MFCTFAITSLFAVNAQNALRGLYGPRSSNMDTQDVDNNLSAGKAVDNKMFFWPIWTKSDAPLPEGAKNTPSKKLFFPGWLRPFRPSPQDAEKGDAEQNIILLTPLPSGRVLNTLSEGKAVDNKMVPLPIWPKSDAPLPQDVEASLAEGKDV